MDDFAGAEHPGRALLAFSQLKRVLQECGLEESEKKACPPSTRMEFLGIVADSVSLTLEIPKDKMLDITRILEEWQVKDQVNVKGIQSLVGKFSCCVYQAGKGFYGADSQFSAISV